MVNEVKVDNEAYLIDHSSDKPICGGSKIYLRATSVTFPFQNLIGAKPRILADPDFTSSDTGSHLGSNWERRKSPITYTGNEKLIITVNGFIDTDGPGSFSSNYQLATIPRLWRLANTPAHMPFYYYDGKVVSSLLNGAYDGNSGTPFGYTGGSIPVVIKSCVIDWRNTSLNKIAYSIELWEDRVMP